MAVLPIRLYPDPVLKQEAETITKVDDRIMKLAKDMLETLYQTPGGIGLAAPQVGESVRMVVIDVAHRLEEENDEPLVIINPEIVEAEGEIEFEEGCLSFPGYTTEITRSEMVRVQALDLNENPVEYVVNDFLAIVFQHELDHLNGKLILDYVSPLKRELYKRKLKKELKDKERDD